MKIRGNTVGTTMKRPDFNQTDPKKSDYIHNNPIPAIDETAEGKLVRVKDGRYVLEDLGYTLDMAIDASTYIMTLYLRNESGNVVSETAIDLPLESMVVGGYEEDGKIFLKLKNGDTVSFELGDFVTGITPHIGANGNWWTGNVDTGVKAAGRSIDRISYKTSATDLAGRVVRYYDVFAGGQNSIGSFTVTDGLDGKDGITPHIKNGYWWIGGTNTNVKAEGKDGKGIKSIARTSGTGAPGTTDTYTITYTDNTTGTFTVYNGKNGADGADGNRGTGILKVSTELTTYTTSTGGKNPIKRMKLSTIKDEADVSEVLVGDIISRSYYLYHIYYIDATYAYIDTYTSIRGATGSNGEDGADGKTPVKGTDYFTAADKNEMVNAVIAQLPIYNGEVETA